MLAAMKAIQNNGPIRSMAFRSAAALLPRVFRPSFGARSLSQMSGAPDLGKCPPGYGVRSLSQALLQNNGLCSSCFGSQVRQLSAPREAIESKAVPVDRGMAKRLRNIFEARRAARAIGVHDALSAKAAEENHFELLQISGYGAAGALRGVPDMDIIPQQEQLDQARKIIHAVSIPVMVDGDTLGAGPLNAEWLTREIIMMGAAGMNMEDQLIPKRCGHMQGKEVIDMNAMVAKVTAAAKIRDELNPDFIINARCDALQIHGEDEVVRRCVAYRKAGADMHFIDGVREIDKLISIKEKVEAALAKEKGGPLTEDEKPFWTYNVMDGVSHPAVLDDIQVLKDNKISRVSIPVGSIQVVHKALDDYYKALKNSPTGFLKGQSQFCTSFKEYTDFVGLPGFKQLEQDYGVKFYDDVNNPLVQGPVKKK